MRLQLLFFLLLPILAASQSTASKQVATFELASPELGVSKKIWIWLPKDYKKSKAAYPVLYMHDAQNVFDAKTSFAGEWNVDETLEKLNAKVIVVGIEHGNEKRMDELTPYPHEKYGGGKADLYLDFIVKTLKPEVDKRYRTKTDAQNTGIMGSSLGGLASFYALLKYPETFAKAGVFSPSFWFSDAIYAFAEQSGDLSGKKIYFLCGDSEDENMVADMEKMIPIVEAKHAIAQKRIVASGKHNEQLWRNNFADAFTWLFTDK